MKDQLSVIFIGGLSNGKIIYDYLNKNRYVNISLVITYSDTYQSRLASSTPTAFPLIKRK